MTTTSLKLPDALKAQIALAAAREGKTAHALMVDTLQTAIEDTLRRQQFYADGRASYEQVLSTNTCYDADDVHAYLLSKAAGNNPPHPLPQPFDASKPMTPEALTRQE